MSQNLVEKIAQTFAVGLEPGHVVHSGDYLAIQPAHVRAQHLGHGDRAVGVLPVLHYRDQGATDRHPSGEACRGTARDAEQRPARDAGRIGHRRTTALTWLSGSESPSTDAASLRTSLLVSLS